MPSVFHSRYPNSYGIAILLSCVAAPWAVLSAEPPTITTKNGISIIGAASKSTRQSFEFDRSWQFFQGASPRAERPEFDASTWELIDLPHDWAIAGPFEESHPASGEGAYLPSGIGWYRKRFLISEDLKDKRVFVEFDGVMANSDVSINGQHLGTRPNGYVSFCYDLTKHLRFGEGEANLLAVRTDTADQVASRWYTGSGIYRHVRLVIVDPLHIGYSGVFVTTPEIHEDHATVNVSVEINNLRALEEAVDIRVEILDDAGNTIASGRESTTVAIAATTNAVVTLDVPHPQLWCLTDPSLYQAVVTLEQNGHTIDELSTSFGIREAEFRSDTGFWLNDENIKLKGVCLHHCGGAMGAAVPLSVWERRLMRLRELGVNAIRTAHNPVAPEFLDLCDRMGFLVMNELFDCWTVGKRKYDYHLHFEEWSDRDARDTVRRDRNHPSVVLYSVGNEIHDTPKADLAKRILSGLVDVCHETDPTRPVTQGLFRPNVSHDYDNGLADLLDVIGTNYRDQELLQAWRDNPTRKIVGTEQGHDRRTWLACRDNRQHAGQFLWCGIDYLGESRSWPVTTYNAGLLDRTGRVHPRGRERQSWWSHAPMVFAFRRLAATEETPTDPGYEVVEWKRRQVLFPDWTPRNLEPHRESVEVFSNCEEVELLLNGESLGAQALPKDAGPRAWKVDFVPGQLVAIGRNAGGEVARHELQTAGPPHRIELNIDRSSLTSKWDDVAHIEAKIVDRRGVLVPRAERKLTFSVIGPGEIVAVDNGSIVSHELFQSDSRTTFQGEALATIRGTTEQTTTDDETLVVVTATSSGLEAGRIEFRVVNR